MSMSTSSIAFLLLALMVMASLTPAMALPELGVPDVAEQDTGPWWRSWASDSDGNGMHDWLEDLAEDALATDPDARLDVVVDLDRSPNGVDIDRLKDLGMEVQHVSRYVDAVLGSLPANAIDAARALPGVVMLEAQGTGYPALASAGPSVALDLVHENLGWDGTGVTVAVLDTGVNANHISLDDLDDDDRTDDPKLVTFFDAYTNTTPEAYDSGEHGSWVSGIAVGTGGNSLNIGGAPGAKLVGVRIGNTGGFPEYAALRGLEWTIENKDTYNISVIVCSWGIVLGGPNDHNGNSAVSRAADEAVAAGISVVVSAGNTALSATVTAPGDAFNVVTVGSVSDNHFLSSFSSEGPTTDGRMKPDVCAPGESITGPYSQNDGQWFTGDGTSASAPLVGGIIAMMIQANPHLTPAQAKQILHETSEHNTARAPPRHLFTPNNGYGWGVVHAPGAVSRARDLRPPTIDIPVSLEAGEQLDLEVKGSYSRTANTERGENGENRLGEDEIIVEATVPSDWERPSMVTYEMDGNIIATVIPDPVSQDGDTWRFGATFRVLTDVEFLTVAQPTIRFTTVTPVVSEPETYALTTQESINGMTGEEGRTRVSVGGNVKPVILVTAPDGGTDTADTFYIVRWEDDDPDDNARISLYNDVDTNRDNGHVLIASNIAEDSEGDGDSYLWDTSTLVHGSSYYILAVIDDGVNEQAHDYSSGTVTVNHAGANVPPSVQVLEPDGSDDEADTSFIIKYVARDPDDDASVSLYWDTDDQGYDGSVIVRDLEEVDGPGQYVWDVSGMEEGLEVYVYVVVTDGHNPQARSYGTGPVTIDHGTRPEVLVALPVGQDVLLDDPVVVTFDRQMDHSATEAATVISPNMAGTYTWSDTTMVYEPGGGWPADTEFTVTIDGSARDTLGNTLGSEYRWTFRTGRTTDPTDPPRIQITSPTEGQTVSAQVFIEGTSEELATGGVVEVRIDGMDWEEATGRALWHLTWDTTGVLDGGHTISARGVVSPGKTGPVATVNVTVRNDPGNPPSVDPVPDLTVEVGEPVSFKVVGRDTDGDALTYTDDSDLFDIHPATGEVSFTPREDQVTDWQVTVTVSDGVHQTNTKFIITVVPKEGSADLFETLPITPMQAFLGLVVLVLIVLAASLAVKRSRRRSGVA